MEISSRCLLARRRRSSEKARYLGRRPENADCPAHSAGRIASLKLRKVEVDLAMKKTRERRLTTLIGPGPETRGGIAQFNAELTRRLREMGASATILAYRRTYPALVRAGRQGTDPSARREDVPVD